MKTSFNSLKIIEHFLQGKLTPEETLLFSAKLLTDPVLRLNLVLQKKTYQIVQLFARREMKTRLEQTHRKLFQDPDKQAFRQSIQDYFVKP